MTINEDDADECVQCNFCFHMTKMPMLDERSEIDNAILATKNENEMPEN